MYSYKSPGPITLVTYRGVATSYQLTSYNYHYKTLLNLNKKMLQNVPS
jgi:hypothetical protein